MRYDLLIATMFAFGTLSGPVRAELLGSAGSMPVFTAGEVDTIARNDFLGAMLAKDPWLLRHILDVAQASSKRNPQVSVPPHRDGVDVKRDAVEAPRDSVGSIEWIELLKKAQKEKQARSADHPSTNEATTSPTNRSATESVGWIELVKRAKAIKSMSK